MDNITLEKLEDVEKINPFVGNEFKTKWFNYYKELQDKSIIQRLYNIDKITKEDYIKIVGEKPQKKEIPTGVILNLKRDILNQDRMLLALDLKLINLNINVPTLLENNINNDYFIFLKRIIENKNYNNKQEIINIVEFYHSKNKISVDDKNNLIELINSK